MTHPATKVTIIAEKLLQKRIVSLIDAAGATGYTIVEGSGKGQHGVRAQNRASVIDAFAIVRIEIIMKDRPSAERVAGQVANECFSDHSGIVYLSEVEIFRPDRF
ncbi:MAG: hypothetical protein AAGB03_04365 [Pseudomonadota bacterium]